MGYLYHITTEALWEEALNTGTYRNPAQAQEGFLHLSTRAQLAASLEMHFAAHTDVVILRLVERQLGQWLKWEPVPGRPEPMPHLYHLLNLEWVDDVELLSRQPDGNWDWEDFMW
ncbi:MAG: DUF952 domain-containing protein [Bacteroidetes bacterium]|nr:DUF952 domain-containing protein [Bacteroidota bacterium]